MKLLSFGPISLLNHSAHEHQAVAQIRSPALHLLHQLSQTTAACLVHVEVGRTNTNILEEDHVTSETYLLK